MEDFLKQTLISSQTLYKEGYNQGYIIGKSEGRIEAYEKMLALLSDTQKTMIKDIPKKGEDTNE